ncbi:MAG: head decoration protein [Succinivibrio sp.]
MSDLRKVETTDYDKLFAGLNHDEIKTMPVVVISGQKLERGALVKMVDGKVTAVTVKTDGVFGIITDTVDASESDAEGVVYVTGDFNKAAIVLGDDLNVDDFIKQCREVGIFLR